MRDNLTIAEQLELNDKFGIFVGYWGEIKTTGEVKYWDNKGTERLIKLLDKLIHPHLKRNKAVNFNDTTSG